MSLGETAWVDRNLKSAWERIRAEVPASWMPLLLQFNEKTGKPYRKLVADELGCGHYGCVMPTGEEGLLCKITSDLSEARFVSAYLTLPKPDVAEGGIVHYEAIYALRDQTHRRRPIFVLWRSEAYDVGFMHDVNNARFAMGKPQAQLMERLGIASYQAGAIAEGAEQVSLFMRWANIAREKMKTLERRVEFQENRKAMLAKVWHAYENASWTTDPRRFRGVDSVGAALAMCKSISLEMANTDVIYPVGAALGDYLEEGLLLADVHLNNIGRNDQNLAVITDPGHVVAINPRWAQWPGVPVI